MGTVSYTPGRPSQWAVRQRALEHVLLGVLPVVLTGWIVFHTYSSGIAAVDFMHSFWVAGWRTLHGLDPYAWTRRQIDGGVSFPYPAVTALLLAPFGLLSSFAESIPVTAAAVLAAPLALWILGVRDWRVYGAAALWAPVVVGWQTANFTLALLVGVAFLWRIRERPLAAAALVACLVSIKPILAPLWIWLVFTRRWRAAALAVAMGAALNAGAWTLLGWHELAAWFHLISFQGRLQGSTGYSLVALVTHLGLGQLVGDASILVFGCLLIGFAWRLADVGSELPGFGVAVLLSIVISPQIDVHYFALLLVPLALMRPRLSWEWLVPLLLWFCPATHADGWQIVVWWVLAGLIAARLGVFSGGRRRHERRIAQPTT